MIQYLFVVLSLSLVNGQGGDKVCAGLPYIDENNNFVYNGQPVYSNVTVGVDEFLGAYTYPGEGDLRSDLVCTRTTLRRNNGIIFGLREPIDFLVDETYLEFVDQTTALKFTSDVLQSSGENFMLDKLSLSQLSEYVSSALGIYRRVRSLPKGSSCEGQAITMYGGPGTYQIVTDGETKTKTEDRHGPHILAGKGTKIVSGPAVTRMLCFTGIRTSPLISFGIVINELKAIPTVIEKVRGETLTRSEYLSNIKEAFCTSVCYIKVHESTNPFELKTLRTCNCKNHFEHETMTVNLTGIYVEDLVCGSYLSPESAAERVGVGPFYSTNDEAEFSKGEDRIGDVYPDSAQASTRDSIIADARAGTLRQTMQRARIHYNLRKKAGRVGGGGAICITICLGYGIADFSKETDEKIQKAMDEMSANLEKRRKDSDQKDKNLHKRIDDLKDRTEIAIEANIAPLRHDVRALAEDNNRLWKAHNQAITQINLLSNVVAENRAAIQRLQFNQLAHDLTISFIFEQMNLLREGEAIYYQGPYEKTPDGCITEKILEYVEFDDLETGNSTVILLTPDAIIPIGDDDYVWYDSETYAPVIIDSGWGSSGGLSGWDIFGMVAIVGLIVGAAIMIYCFCCKKRGL